MTEASVQRLLSSAVVCVAMTCTTTLAARADGANDDSLHFFVSSGLDYSSGKYGTADTTTILYAPITMQARAGFLAIRVSSGWMEIDGTGVIAGIDGPIVLPGGGTTNHTSGLADTTIQARFLLSSGLNFPGVELIGKVKLPTGDKDKALGTGETDYAAQIDMFQAFGATMLFGTLGYKVYGDPAGIDLDNVPYGCAGLSFKASPAWSFGGSLDWRQAITSSSSDKLELTPFAKFRFADDWSVMAYVDAGLADGSPDWGAGLSIKWGS